MSALTNSPNHFLASLAKHEHGLLEPHLRAIQLPPGRIVYDTEQTVQQVLFPNTGVVSNVVGSADGQFLEAGMFGRNGVVGSAAALDSSIALNRAVIQVSASCLIIDAAVLGRLAAQSSVLLNSLIRYERAAYAQVQQTLVCNTLHPLEARLSRWLLQTRDLAQTDVLPLTQEFLSQMLGVQRSSVNLVARNLQQAGLLRYQRGRINILDVNGLQDVSCECYGVINEHYRQLIGWTP